LSLDGAGRLYGTTEAGGPYNHGTVFELTNEQGKWTESVLYNFCSPTGCPSGFPDANVIFDKSGNLFGTTQYGGAHNEGTVFELIHSGGKWTPKLLHSFNRGAKDGAFPVAHLVLDRSGALYGTTTLGGAGDYGTVFQLVSTQGKWTESVVYSFNVLDGSTPLAGLILAKPGKLYGSTAQGGAYGGGTLFDLVLQNGSWVESVLHSFGHGGDGIGPRSLVMDKAGNLFGTTIAGGSHKGGTVFEFTP
jgi:uncharacterized repeat protein (TIGR03803 family)